MKGSLRLINVHVECTRIPISRIKVELLGIVD